MNEWVHEDETLEDLQLSGYHILQKKKGFRFGMDAVLLADFATIYADHSVADFGTGTGILPLLLMGRGKGSMFYAFEIQEMMASMAQRTMQMNGLTERVRIYHRDAVSAPDLLGCCSMDAVICNPPYGIPGRTLLNPNENRSVSRHQQGTSLDQLLTAAFRVLKGRGRLNLVYPAPQMLFLFEALQAAHLEPKRFRLVYPNIQSPAHLVLVEAVKDAKPMLHPMPPLIIYQENGDLTNELKSVYHVC